MYIYKITNKVNGKVYIGQTNNPRKRFSEHRTSYRNKDRKDYHSKKNMAFRKYGPESFVFEIVETIESGCRKEADSREEYWISYFNSFEKGYNSTPASTRPPSLIRENHPGAKLSERDVSEIVDLLLNSDKDISDIAKAYSVSRASVSNISTGKGWHSEALSYPLRDDTLSRKGGLNGSAKIGDELALKIRKEFVHKTVRELKDEYAHLSSRSSIKKILSGETYRHLPIYRKRKRRWE